MAAADRRRLDTTKQQGGGAAPPGSQPPGLHHHHSMSSAVGTQQPHSIAPHPGAGRPGLDRAHTFPTPPTSASSTTIGQNSMGGSYGWESQSIGTGVQGAQPLMLDHPHSTPATPATTPPGAPMPGLQPYQSHPTFDNSRPMYSAAATQQSQYVSNMARGTPIQSNTYNKQDMGPPAVRAPGSRTGSEHGDTKSDVYIQGQGNEHGAVEDAEHEQDSDYAHDNTATYAAHRGSYSSYNPGTNLTSLQGENGQATSSINGSPSHPNGSDRGTPRISNGAQQQWSTGYHTPPRAPPSSNLYNPMSDARGTASNGGTNGDHYAAAPLHPYAPTQANGIPASNKRMRDDDDYSNRPASRGDDIEALKRRKMGREGSSASNVAAGTYESDIMSTNHSRPRTMATPRARVR